MGPAGAVGTVAPADSAGANVPQRGSARVSETDPQAAGLCASCRHVRVVATPRSQFLLCERSRTDPTYARYPRLPMRECPGYEQAEPSAGAAGGDTPDDGEGN